MERMTGVEPATFSLATRRSSQLNYIRMKILGGADRGRSGNLLRARQAFSQLNYGPKGAGLAEDRSSGDSSTRHRRSG